MSLFVPCTLAAAKVRSFGYNGSSVATENLRQLCLFRELSGPHHTAPWLWWDYAVRHADHCKMTEVGGCTISARCRFSSSSVNKS